MTDPTPTASPATATPRAPSAGTVLVIGAGTMGAGIAQVAATSGWTARVMDLDRERAESALAGVRGRIDRMEEKGRLDASEAGAARARLEIAGDTPAAAAAGCDLVIEAIVEDLDAKVAALSALVPHLPADAIIATNTSSLSVGELGQRLGESARTVGMHFFNPAPLLKLVEVVPGDGTNEAIVARVRAIAESWDKIVAVAKDAPGFIVNHVARPYYLEAFRTLADGMADVATIDGAMRTTGKFRMGPFELTDLIGQDVNTATTRSVWERLEQPPLLAPSELQESLVTAGDLGRKTGRGVYDHTADPPLPVLTVRAQPLPDGEEFVAAAIAFGASAADAVGGQATTEPRGAVAFGRILLALITQAQRAAALGIGSASDIDTALRHGVNYPLGPLSWAESIGSARMDAWRAALLAQPGGDRFARDG